MLLIRIELHPADGSAKRDLGIMKIINDQSGNGEIANYNVTFERCDLNVANPPEARVLGFRKRRGPWWLLYRALRNCLDAG